MIDGVASQPFTAFSMPPIAAYTGNKDKIIKVSRERYARSRSEIEEKIAKWSGMDMGDEDSEEMDGELKEIINSPNGEYVEEVKEPKEVEDDSRKKQWGDDEDFYPEIDISESDEETNTETAHSALDMLINTNSATDEIDILTELRKKEEESVRQSQNTNQNTQGEPGQSKKKKRKRKKSQNSSSNTQNESHQTHDSVKHEVKNTNTQPQQIDEAPKKIPPNTPITFNT